MLHFPILFRHPWKIFGSLMSNCLRLFILGENKHTVPQKIEEISSTRFLIFRELERVLWEGGRLGGGSRRGGGGQHHCHQKCGRGGSRGDPGSFGGGGGQHHCQKKSNSSLGRGPNPGGGGGGGPREQPPAGCQARKKNMCTTIHTDVTASPIHQHFSGVHGGYI